MKMKGNFFRYVSVLIFIIFFLQSVPLYAASMTDYCVIPPYVKRDVQPNIFVIMDNYYRMADQAYTDNYDPTKTYTGYFQSNVYYSYGSGNQFVPDLNGIFKGNLLNWVMTSRYDLLQSILVGGVSASRQLRQVNTLKSISNTWRKTYSGCVFDVNGGSIQVSESVGNACRLLDPARLSASLQPIVIAKNDLPLNLFKTIAENTKSASEKFFDFLIAPALAAPAQPLEITTTSPLLSATEGATYNVTVQAVQRPVQEPFSWDITAGSLPAGLTLEASTRLGAGISGTPSAGTAGGELNCAISGYFGKSYSFTVRITDKNGTTASKVLSIFVNCPVLRPPQTYTGRVCAGDYALNCNSSTLGCVSDSDCPSNECANGTCSLKSGIIELFWTQARFGLGAFVQSGNSVSTSIPTTPTSAGCIPASPMTSYMSAGVENTQPNVDAALTPLINAEYDAISYYANDTSNSCNPFNGASACLRNNILIISSGDGANTYNTTPYVYTDNINCGSLTYTLSKNTCFGYKNDLRNSPTFGGENLPGTQNVSTYIVNVMGVNGNILAEAATAGGGLYYNVTDPTTLRAQLIQAFQDIIKRAAAGTAASVLASGEGSGANLIQAVFYPRRKFFNSATGTYDEIAWIGRLTNFWYYVDPFFTTSTLLEDTTSDKILNISNDNKLKLRFDPTTQTTVADRYPFGSVTLIDTIPFEYTKYLWEAGVLLWNRNLTSSPRTIYTTINGTSLLSGGFSTTNASTLRSYLLANTDSESEAIIRYLHGEGDTLTVSGTTYNYRSRTVSVDLNGDGDTLDTVDGISESPSRVWKLSDILNSTPKISSWIQLNTYDSKYSDTTYTSFINSSTYNSRGMVFVGANDGMLHAFKLGTMELNWTGKILAQKARLTGTNLGQEMWAFIPENALPYLKYIAAPDYCHVYSVDLAPYVFDASIGGNPDDTKDVSSWRTILIGGMRFGGACRDTSSSCTDCVKTPVSGLGYSSYFALDVTDQNNPQLLWEFSDPALGFATTGPAVVRIGADTTKNGKWFVVFGSGPTGPISTSDQQFLGRSDQPLKFFVIGPLSATPGLPTVTPLDPSPSIPNAFAGSMLNSTIDTDLDYQDDAIYIGYVKKAGDGTWTQGGVGRIQTKEDTDPSNWVWSKVIDDIGPVTSSVTRLQNNKYHILWLYFGTGRYYYEILTNVDDQDSRRTLIGIKEPCFTSTNTLDSTCTTTRIFCSTPCSDSTCSGPSTCGDLSNVTPIGNVPAETTANSASFKGWYIGLDPSGNYTYNEGGTNVTRAYRAERVITDPLSTTSGLVFFTTYKPYNDVCAYGGKSFLWAVRYTTGGAPGALLKGVALLQVSTGSIEQVNLSTAFTEAGGRKTSALEGVPPTAQGLSLLSQPPPVKRVIHMRER
jgi:hypothetical protein